MWFQTLIVTAGVAVVLSGCGALGPGTIGYYASTIDRSPGGPPAASSLQKALRAVGFATAKEGLGQAVFAAKKWDGAARIGRIEGTAIEKGYMLGDWGYTFYSPLKQDKALLVVWDGTGTKSFEIRKDPLATPIFGGQFSLDSREAIGIAELNGLRSRKVYRIILAAENTALRLTWTLQSPDGEFEIDAHTGELLKPL